METFIFPVTVPPPAPSQSRNALSGRSGGRRTFAPGDGKGPEPPTPSGDAAVEWPRLFQDLSWTSGTPWGPLGSWLGHGWVVVGSWLGHHWSPQRQCPNPIPIQDSGGSNPTPQTFQNPREENKKKKPKKPRSPLHPSGPTPNSSAALFPAFPGAPAHRAGGDGPFSTQKTNTVISEASAGRGGEGRAAIGILGRREVRFLLGLRFCPTSVWPRGVFVGCFSFSGVGFGSGWWRLGLGIPSPKTTSATKPHPRSPKSQL